LSGLESLQSIAKDLDISYDYTLHEINALSSLQTIGQSLSLKYNKGLPSLSGLDNFNTETLTSLTLENCDILSECSVSSICHYLANGGQLSLTDNFTGCNSREE
jgi:hypothetical protein